MKQKRFVAAATAMLMCIAVGGYAAVAGQETQPQVKVLDKSVSGNPMLGFDENGDVLYGGDPSIFVDGDTVYCYVGHDTSTGEYYHMPDWR